MVFACNDKRKSPPLSPSRRTSRYRFFPSLFRHISTWYAVALLKSRRAGLRTMSRAPGTDRLAQTRDIDAREMRAVSRRFQGWKRREVAEASQGIGKRAQLIMRSRIRSLTWLTV